MKICILSPKIHNFLSTGFESGAGGAERQQYLIAKMLRERGHEVALVTRNFNDGERKTTIDGFEVWKTIPDVRGVSGAPKKTAAVWKTIYECEPDSVFVRGNDFLCVLASTFCRLFNYTFVYSVSNDADIEPQHLERFSPLYRTIFVESIRSADNVIAQTPHQRSVLNDEHGIESTIITNGYSLSPDSEIVPAEEREYVLWVGRLDKKQKRPMRFIELSKAIPNESFVLIGPPDDDDPEYAKEIEKMAQQVENLDFEGFVKPGEIDQYFKRAKALVNTSDFEGLPNTFLEAWRFGTPVISLKYAFDGRIEEHNLGRHSGSMKRLKEDVKEIAGDVDTREKMCRDTRRYIQQNHTLESVVDAYEKAFTGDRN
ncbi:MULTISPECIES: glycosyltransferase family 4 protein [Haloferax]|uniref:Glycosyltransferase n=1 Tax=Haloferax marinum TaxID=2666143 RepID=A0A6A8G331_9EURY|nr:MULTISPECIES: glycosyltransferase family 4 protein [Haloferax]KAB1196261.1 glycosyltransferase family 4 protein [Haloferax sp. CBA1150]MRW95249.1 glycosyltransferase [Haloferax marinum]